MEQELYDAAAAAAAASALPPNASVCPPAPSDPRIFSLANGHVTPAEDADFPARTDQPEGNKRGGTGTAFWFYNSRLSNPMLLYGNQTVRLISELPRAYKAFRIRDYSYRFVLVENKHTLITLEVTNYRDKPYLFLKKYFKPNRSTLHPSSPLGEVDENAWLPTKSSVSFDPDTDHPQALLRFVLTCAKQK